MSKHSNRYTITSALPKGHIKKITLAGSGKSNVVLSVPRFALVGKRDQISMGAAGNSKISVIPSDGIDGLIPVTPVFAKRDQIRIGNHEIDLNISEISTPNDLSALKFLQQFHYKTNDALTSEDSEDPEAQSFGSTGGRRAILYASVRIGQRWTAAGYIELQMPLMMCKPRHDLFHHPFKHPERAVEWEIWNQHTVKKYLNLIVRIGRVVVSPELRGLGIARHLIRAAQEFSPKRWHIGGYRPLFMEISAEMLSHVDFVSSVGFFFVGMTEGNLARVVKDMKAMVLAPSGEFGIMSVQRKYFRALEDYCKTLDLTFEEGVKVLRKKIEVNQDSLSSGDWAALRAVIRLPIPYYLCALDNYTKDYLRAALKANPPNIDVTSRIKPFSARSVQIDISEFSIRAQYNIPKSRSTQIIMNAFGLRGDTIFADLVPTMPVKASNGNITLVVGASGSGKSVFLRALDPAIST